MLGRWLAGFFFSWRDLEILDDPIPAKLYCKAFRKDERKGSLKGLEEGEADIDSKEPGVDEVDGGERGETRKVNGNLPSKSFNMSQEVDRCDLWRNMIHNLDAPPPSPRKTTRRHGGAPVGTLAGIPEITVEREASMSQMGAGEEEVKFELGEPSEQPSGHVYQSTAV